MSIQAAAWLLIFCVATAYCSVTNVTQIIEGYGYTCEQHWATTEDGFVLSLQRIPRPGSPVVFLQHGVLDSANTWVMNDPSESLSFILADSGFDVWLGNSRGNSYSMQNIKFQQNSDAYWAWSFDEMAQFDLAASILEIVRVTGAPKIGYVGHSQGTTIAFAAFSRNATLASYISHAVMLAPVAFIGHQSSLLLSAVARVPQKLIYTAVGKQAFIPTSGLLDHFIPKICTILPVACRFPACALAGCDMSDFNTSRIPFYFDHFPRPTAVQNMVHWAQMVKSGTFGAYDFGSADENTKHYGQPTPPEYRLHDFHVPCSIFYGGKDVLADPTDVQSYILKQVPSIVYQQQIPAYGHLDFVWGQDVVDSLYRKVVSLLQTSAQMIH